MPTSIRFHLADAARADQFAGRAELVVGALLRAGLHDALVLACGGDHRAAFGDGVRQRLFAVDVLARLARAHGLQGVPMVGRADDHGVDVLAFEQLAEVAVDVALAVLGGHRLLGVGRTLLVDVAHGRGLGEELAHVRLALPADADVPGDDLLVGPEGACRAPDTARPPPRPRSGPKISETSAAKAAERPWSTPWVGLPDLQVSVGGRIPGFRGTAWQASIIVRRRGGCKWTLLPSAVGRSLTASPRERAL